MSYTYKVVSDFPSAAYPLSPGETGGFIDVSGNANNAVNYGTMPIAPPLVSGGGNSYIVSDLNGFSFLTNLFLGDDVQQSFTLEAWFKHKDSVGTIQILGHDHAGDGILWNGDAISFVTKHGAAGNAVVTYYPPDVAGAFYVVAVHSSNKNLLYVNQELVGSVELTDEQMKTPYTTTANAGRLYSGHAISGATGTVIVDSLALYRRQLSVESVKQHYEWAKRVVDFRELAKGADSYMWAFTDFESTLTLDEAFDTYEEWQRGYYDQINVTDTLRPAFDGTELSVYGEWTYGLPLEEIATVIDGSKIEWDADGTFVIESSLNSGTTWTPCVNGREIAGISSGFTTAAKSIDIRINFPAGQSSTTSTVFRSLKIKFYQTRSPFGLDTSRKALITGAAALSDGFYQPIDSNDGMGVEVYGGNIVIQKDVDEDPAPVRTVEMWVKINANPPVDGTIILDGREAGADSSAFVSISMARQLAFSTGASIYLDGVAYNNAVLDVNRWYHLTFAMTFDNFKNITLGSRFDNILKVNASFGLVVFHNSLLTAASVLQLYNSYLGITGLSIVETTVVGVSESNGVNLPVRIYAYDWSIASGG